MNTAENNAKNGKQCLTILIAEDNMINQRLLMASLTKFGHKVDAVADGQIAVNKFKENKYDVVLMDIMMPKMDGVTACKLIREYERSQDIADSDRTPIIAITANAFEDDRDNFLEAGMDEMMNKPVDIEKLQHILNQI